MVLSMKEIGIGMLGHSWMGRTHTEAFKRHGLHFPTQYRPRFVGIFGRNEEKLKADADRWGYGYATTDIDRIISDDSVEIVVNALPNHLHMDPCIAAAEAGKDVICEKPLALNPEQSAAMLAAAENSGIKDMMVFNYRWLPAIQLARRMIDGGRIGKVLQYRGIYCQSWLVSPNAVASWKTLKGSSGAGVLFDLGPHAFDLAMHLVGPMTDLIAQKALFAQSRLKPDGSIAEAQELGEELVSCLVKFKNGALGTIEVSRVSTGFKNKNRIEIHGTEGALAFDLENLNSLQIFDENQDPPGFRNFVVDSHNVGWSRAFLLQTHHFLECLEDDRRPQPNWSNGHAIQTLLANVLQSAESGEWVKAL
jgi:predicted dehydrogenase